jgi:hypothetical protein
VQRKWKIARIRQRSRREHLSPFASMKRLKKLTMKATQDRERVVALTDNATATRPMLVL